MTAIAVLLLAPLQATTTPVTRSPDALVVGPAGGRDARPTLLTDRNRLAREATRSWLSAHAGDLRRMYLAGSTAAIAANVDVEVAAVLGRTAIPGARTTGRQLR